MKPNLSAPRRRDAQRSAPLRVAATRGSSTTRYRAVTVHVSAVAAEELVVIDPRINEAIAVEIEVVTEVRHPQSTADRRPISAGVRIIHVAVAVVGRWR